MRRRSILAALALSGAMSPAHAAVSTSSDFARAGALASYGAYALTINLRTAKAIGLTLPTALLASADEVIE